MKDIDVLKEQLNKDNKVYYAEVHSYILGRSILLKSEKEAEDILLELLNDLLEAQSQGLSAEDYFGKNPRVMCDDILNNLKKETFINKSKIVITLFLLTLGLNGFTKLVYPEDLFDVGKFTIKFIIIAIMLYFMMILLQDHIFDKNKSIKNIIILYFIYSIFDGLVNLLPDLWKVDLSGVKGIVFIIISTLSITAIVLYRSRKSREILFVIFIPATIAVLNRIEATSYFFKTKIGTFIIEYNYIIAWMTVIIIILLSEKNKSKKVK